MTDPAYLNQLIRIPTEARRLYPRGELFDLEPAPLQVLIALVLDAADDTAGLVDVLAMNRSTVSHGLRVLQERRLVQRSDDPADGRHSLLSATREGHRVVEAFAHARKSR